MSKVSFIAAGDAFMTRRLPKDGYEGFADMQSCIKAHDVAFLNLESTFHDGEGCPSAVSGGTWAMSDPRILDDIKEFGFNLFNTANNHSCDYGHGGLLATVRNLKERDMLFAGTGKHLGDASKPCYFEANGMRIALICCATPYNDEVRAGAQSVNLPGRPGLNPIRNQKRFHVDKEHYEMLQELARVTCINASHEHGIETGYYAPDPEGVFPFGKAMFVLDDHCWVESVPNAQDMARIEGEIREAKKQADVVLVSIHTHDYDRKETNIPSLYLEKFSHACIDAGANVIIGHGPHELQGIEKYNGGLILYSIGNYIFQTETVEFQPWDAYVNKGFPTDMKVGEYMDRRSNNGTTGYGTLPELWNSVMVAWEMDGQRITGVKLYPVTLHMDKSRAQKGLPELSGSEETLAYLDSLSKPYGTDIEIRDGVGYITFEE